MLDHADRLPIRTPFDHLHVRFAAELAQKTLNERAFGRLWRTYNDATAIKCYVAFHAASATASA